MEQINKQQTNHATTESTTTTEINVPHVSQLNDKLQAVLTTQRIG